LTESIYASRKNLASLFISKVVKRLFGPQKISRSYVPGRHRILLAVMLILILRKPSNPGGRDAALSLP
jgi:hypothetical protein